MSYLQIAKDWERKKSFQKQFYQTWDEIEKHYPHSHSDEFVRFVFNEAPELNKKIDDTELEIDAIWSRGLKGEEVTEEFTEKLKELYNLYLEAFKLFERR